MICKKYSQQIDDLVENRLDEQAAEQVTLHLIACPNCEAAFEHLSVQSESYTNLLFKIEPPNDLPAKFMAKLELAEQKESAANESAGFYQRLSQTFAFPRSRPAFSAMALIVLLALGFGFFKFVGDKELAVNNPSSPTVSESPSPGFSMFEKSATEKSKELSIDFDTAKPKILRTKTTEIPTLRKELPKAIALKRTAVRKTETKRENAPEISKLSAAEENQIAQVQSLENDAARQIEKIEILFRAFRNVRAVEGNGRFDVDYEKQQARKLLEKNAELRQRAEIYGTLLTEKTLKEVEPYLLDIANLDGKPSAEQVSEIKNRFQSQQIIANLQGF